MTAIPTLLMVLGFATGWRKEASVASLAFWGAALIGLVACGMWPVNIAICGIVVGLRAGAVMEARS